MSSKIKQICAIMGLFKNNDRCFKHSMKLSTLDHMAETGCSCLTIILIWAECVCCPEDWPTSWPLLIIYNSFFSHIYRFREVHILPEFNTENVLFCFLYFQLFSKYIDFSNFEKYKIYWPSLIIIWKKPFLLKGLTKFINHPTNKNYIFTQDKEKY